jgi:hypothetical protein
MGGCLTRKPRKAASGFVPRFRVEVLVTMPVGGCLIPYAIPYFHAQGCTVALETLFPPLTFCQIFLSNKNIT